MVSQAEEFENIKSRDEELTELKELSDPDYCVCQIKGTPDTNYGKTNILLQAYISRATISDFALGTESVLMCSFGYSLRREKFCKNTTSFV